MFNRATYEELLATYVSCMMHWDNHPLSGSARREVRIAKEGLDIYITDHTERPTSIFIDDMEPIHRFFRD